MRWSPGGSNPDVEDRRGQSVGRGMPLGRLGIGGVIAALIISVVFKQDFFSLLSGAPVTTSSDSVVSSPGEDTLKQFIEFVLADVQSTWDSTLQEQTGTPYSHAHLVLFRDAVESACGLAQSATGPFYCPSDQKVYIDLGFYEELSQRFGAPGDFAQAYVLAHEIGHHVQYLLGTSSKVHAAQQSDPRAGNELSVRLELQADCFAGVWGSSARTRDKLTPGDVDEGLRAAAAVGDDRIKRMGGRAVNPDAFTHGSAEQRATWFRKGFESGRVSACNTF